MANWRKIHINNDEWEWVISKGCFHSVVIREPNRGKCHTVSMDEISYTVTPGIIKDYITQNLIK